MLLVVKGLTIFISFKNTEFVFRDYTKKEAWRCFSGTILSSHVRGQGSFPSQCIKPLSFRSLILTSHCVWSIYNNWICKSSKCMVRILFYILFYLWVGFNYRQHLDRELQLQLHLRPYREQASMKTQRGSWLRLLQQSVMLTVSVILDCSQGFTESPYTVTAYRIINMQYSYTVIVVPFD